MTFLTLLFIIVAVSGLTGWVLLLVSAGKPSLLKKSGLVLVFTGLLAISVTIVFLWIELQRPPMRTLGETRLWYAFFLSLIGILIYLRWKILPMLGYGILLSLVFLLIDLLNPAVMQKELMPALQSIWFIPHVIVYMISYALLGMSMFFGIYGIYRDSRNKEINSLLIKADNLVYLGFSFLTLGLIFGAMWAKTAWGHYWTWDPKETWAFITWGCYLLYIHFRIARPGRKKVAMLLLSLMFIVLLVCWFGVNYLSSAQNSVHIYQ